MQVLGNGIYSYPECARLLGIRSRRVWGWYHGWHGRESLLRSDYEGMFPSPAISFLDFVDAAVACTLHAKHGVIIQTIRKLRKQLAGEWNTPHPFAREEFYTDERGRNVFYLCAEEDGERHLVEILKRQYAIPEVLLPFLKRVEYDKRTKLAQVFPLSGRVVLDPRRKFGKPTVEGTGMLTVILYKCYLETGSEDQVADWYNVNPEDVEEAVRFETEFRGIAA